jgi:hypothetical protein
MLVAAHALACTRHEPFDHDLLVRFGLWPVNSYAVLLKRVDGGCFNRVTTFMHFSLVA